MVLVVVVDTMEEAVALLSAEVDVITFIPVEVDHLILKGV
jgi:hypothetical protein